MTKQHGMLLSLLILRYDNESETDEEMSDNGDSNSSDVSTFLTLVHLVTLRIIRFWIGKGLMHERDRVVLCIFLPAVIPFLLLIAILPIKF